MTSDTVSLSRIFLQNLDKMRGSLFIYITINFDYEMEAETEFLDLIKETRNKNITTLARLNREKGESGTHGKVIFATFSETEKLYCVNNGLDVKNVKVIPPIGDLPTVDDVTLGLQAHEIKMYGPLGDPWVCDIRC